MIVNPMGVGERSFSGSFLHLGDIRIDDVELNITPFTDEDGFGDDEQVLNDWYTNYIEGYVMNEVATTEANVVSWFHAAGNAYKNTDASRICTADGQDCYDTRVMPIVSNIDHSSGYTTGGQEINIEGKSLNMAEPVVTVDGVECTVTEYDFYNIKCVTGERELE